MNKGLVIIGAGGHAKVCYEIALKMNRWQNIYVLDDNPVNEYFTINGSLNDIALYYEYDFFVAIGSNCIRKKIYEKYLKKYNLATLIHPSAVISETAKIGPMSVVMPNVVVNSNTIIGQGCILNTACTLDHDSSMENFVHVSPGVNIAGNVKIGSGTWLGIGTVVKNNISIGKNIQTGAGSLIINNVFDEGIYHGSPAKLQSKGESE